MKHSLADVTVQRLLTFAQYQMPPNYDVDTERNFNLLKPTFLSKRNKELAQLLGLKPFKETAGDYFY